MVPSPASIRTDVSENTAGSLLQLSAEILSEIVNHCDWKALVRLAHCSGNLRAVSQDVASSRIWETIKAILEAFGVNRATFFSALLRNDGALVGTSAVSTVYWGSEWMESYKKSTCVTVMVPLGLVERFLKDLNVVEGWEHQGVLRAAANTVKSVRMKESSTGGSQEKVYLKLVESTGHTLQGIVASQSTEDMVLITGSRIYLLYPPLVHRNIAFSRSRHHLQAQDPNSMAPIYSSSSEHWGFPCGVWCPRNPRKCREGEGVGVFYWNKELVKETWKAAVAAVPDSMNVAWGGGREDATQDDVNAIPLEWRHLSWRGRYFMKELQSSDLLGRDDFKFFISDRCNNPDCNWPLD
ncbi:hypothetical protein BKA70DRAFT_1121462 [Coprinopsis sp. MPI-PUGE-AT-0042]|nr:hypothetical protein BKA70DRAFT_1121462 [Coprinopsis sp. MPI-PUGE-AT-0042]